MKEAKFYNVLPDDKVQCQLCPHYCVIENGKAGKCRGRINEDGFLIAMNYGKTIALSIDPMEKKPLYHFHPGSPILSIGPNSCNLTCDFCQNYQSSQSDTYTQEITPETLLYHCREQNCSFVAFTYTEPLTWFEFVLDTAKYLKENNIKTVLVTNGYINTEPLLRLLPYIDAMNIDLKSIRNEFYKKLCGGSVKPVLETIKSADEHCHIEITNLLITEQNDKEEDITELVDFVASVNKEIPLHFSRYYPNYKMKLAATDIEILERAKCLASERLDYVYLGNIMTNKDTICPQCKSVIIKRSFGAVSRLLDNKCFSCGHQIYGRF